MEVYRHKQEGTLMVILISLAAVALTLTMAISPVSQGVNGVIALSLLFILLAFHDLTVEVHPRKVKISFGVGWLKKNLEVANISSARRVANPWYCGWGIRLIPGGWLYNVSGFDAVELDMKPRGKIRIGTDEPQELLAAILKAMEASGKSDA